MCNYKNRMLNSRYKLLGGEGWKENLNWGQKIDTEFENESYARKIFTG